MDIKENIQALDLVQKSGILNPNVTLDQIMALSKTIVEQRQALSAAPHGGIDTVVGLWFYVVHIHW